MRYTTHGNARPHIVHHGYRNTPRVAGPLEREAPLNWPLIAVGPALGLVAALLGVMA